MLGCLFFFHSSTHCAPGGVTRHTRGVQSAPADASRRQVQASPEHSAHHRRERGAAWAPQKACSSVPSSISHTHTRPSAPQVAHRRPQGERRAAETAAVVPALCGCRIEMSALPIHGSSTMTPPAAVETWMRVSTRTQTEQEMFAVLMTSHPQAHHRKRSGPSMHRVECRDQPRIGPFLREGRGVLLQRVCALLHPKVPQLRRGNSASKYTKKGCAM